MDTAMDADQLWKAVLVTGSITFVGYIVLIFVAGISLNENGDIKTDTKISGIDTVIEVCGSSLRNIVLADAVVGSVVAIGLIAWGFYEYSLIVEEDRKLKQKQNAEAKISGVVRVDTGRKPEQKQNTEAKILGVFYRCVMLALLALIMGLLTHYTIKAHDEAKDMTRCFETMHNPFNSPLKTQDTPMMARVAMAFTIFFSIIGGVAFIGMVIYALWRGCVYPPP